MNNKIRNLIKCVRRFQYIYIVYINHILERICCVVRNTIIKCNTKTVLISFTTKCKSTTSKL